MLEELKLRGFVKPNEKVSSSLRENKDHIVIISEWDTIYGRRGLPKAMKKTLVPTMEKQGIPMKNYCGEWQIRNNQCNDWWDDVNWIHSFSYMRGLDGVIPGAEKTTEETKTNKDKEKNNGVEINQERPEGQGQQDYLRRLATHIDELKQTLENNHEGEIKAIGVLGSDAYDNLMILKALRPSFPKAIFFTTDLDTRLMHPKEFDVTRNLVVAASFDLHLASKLQKSIPPFRDSYQTANFFATQIAVDNANGKKLTQDNINTMLGTARLFETGNNKAIALNYSNENKTTSFKTKLRKAIGLSKDDEVGDDLQPYKNAHPPPPSKNSTHILWVIGLIIFSGIMSCGYLFSNHVQSYLKKQLRFIKHWFTNSHLETADHLETDENVNAIIHISRVVKALILIVLVGGTLYVTYAEINLGDKGEPFYWNQGVSVWPSVIIRLFAGIFGYLFIAKTITAMTKNNRQLTRDFYFTPLENLSPKNVARLWNQYRSELFNWNHCIKITVFSILFIVFAFSLMCIFGFPSVPYRGYASEIANFLALRFSVIMFTVLIMTVFFTTLHSIGLIIELDSVHSVWPQTTLCHFGLRPPLTASEPLAFNNELKKLRKILTVQNDYYLDEWLDIKFIAAHTKELGKLIYYPYIILALMILARSKTFDNWDMPISLVIVYVIAATLTLGSAFYLRRVAEHSRQHIIKKITRTKIALSYQSDSTAHMIMEKQVDLALAYIQEINEGAFQPLTNEPAIQALLIPFGGIGGVMLLENFVLTGF